MVIPFHTFKTRNLQPNEAWGREGEIIRFIAIQKAKITVWNRKWFHSLDLPSVCLCAQFNGERAPWGIDDGFISVSSSWSSKFVENLECYAWFPHMQEFPKLHALFLVRWDSMSHVFTFLLCIYVACSFCFKCVLWCTSLSLIWLPNMILGYW
jgi:hypothetical protein